MQFIKGHQDRKTAYRRLPLLAQLNVDADHMAGLFQDEHGRERPVVMMSPRAGVHLDEYQSGTVLSNYAQSIRHESTGPPLYQYIQQRNQWSTPEMQSINWEAHGCAMKKQIHRQVHNTKLVHDLLPTQSLRNKYDAGRRVCPGCPEISEDRDHILRCPSAGRNKWRHSFLAELHTFCVANDTYAPLQNLLATSLRAWLYHASMWEYKPNPTEYPQELQLLLRQQLRIGWRQVFNGRFSTEWAHLQDAYYHRTSSSNTLPSNSRSGHKWQIKLITFIWEKWHSLWKCGTKTSTERMP